VAAEGGCDRGIGHGRRLGRLLDFKDLNLFRIFEQRQRVEGSPGRFACGFPSDEGIPTELSVLARVRHDQYGTPALKR
jgi:hypothetical protein